MVWPVRETAWLVISHNNSTARYLSKKSENMSTMPWHQFSLFVIAQSGNSPAVHPNRWRDKMWFIHTMEHYSAMQRNKILRPVIAWMNPKVITSERQIQWTQFHLYEMSKKSKCTRRESRSLVPAAPQHLMPLTHVTSVGVSPHSMWARERPQTWVLAPTLGKQKGGCQHSAWYITGSREGAWA